MARNIIREDVVQIGFEVKDNPITKLNKEMEKLKKILSGSIGDDTFDDLTKDAKKAEESIKDVNEQTKKLSGKLKDFARTSFEKLKAGLKGVSVRLSDIAKKAGGAAYQGLKRLAGISFKGLVAGLGAAATGIAYLVKNSVSEYANMEQQIGGTETLFGANGVKTVEEYAQSVGKSVSQVQGQYDKLKASEAAALKNANNAYKTVGVSANTYMENVTSFAAAMKMSVGGDTMKAVELSDLAMKDIGDNANKMGNDLESVMNVYQALSKDQYMTLDNLKLGYAGTKEGAQKLIKHAATLDKSIKANDMSFSNLVKAIHAVQVELGITGTTDKEATETISGSLNALNATWQNLMPALIVGGDSFDQCLNNLIDALSTFGKNIMPAIQSALGGIGTLIERMAPQIEKYFPVLVDTLLPPLLEAATSLLNAFIKALPSIISTIMQKLPDIIKSIGEAIVEAFGGDASIVGKFGEALTKNASIVAKSVPYLLGAFAAFKVLKKVVPFVIGLFNKGEKSTKSGGFLANIGKQFAELGQTKTADIAKGLANLTIIVGGMALLTVAIAAITALVNKIANPTDMLIVVGIIGALGLVGAGLAKLGQIVGNIPVSTVAKGLANMAIMIGGLSALYLVVGAVSLINFDLERVMGIVKIIGVIGIVGTALSVLAMILGAVGLLTGGMSVAAIAIGLANMAIMIVGLSGLVVVLAAVSKLPFDLNAVAQLVTIIDSIGTVGAKLALFAGIVGIIPVPLVLLGLVNIGLVIGGIIALAIKLSELQQYSEQIISGLNVFATVMNGIGKALGALVGGVLEKISESLPKIGENLSAFGTSIQPLFNAFKDVNTEGISKFFDAIGSFMLQMSGSKILDFFSGGVDFSSIAEGLNTLANSEGVKNFFAMVNNIEETAFDKGKKLFECLAGISQLPNAGGIAQAFSGTNDFEGVSTGLGKLASEGVKNFFNMVAAIEDTAFDKGKKLFETLSNVSQLPNAGGFAQAFSGTNDFSGVANGLSTLSSEGVKNFFGMVQGLAPETFEKTTQLFSTLGSEELQKIGKLFNDKNSGGITILASALNDFTAKTLPFFVMVNMINTSALTALWVALGKVSEIAAKDFSSLPEKGTQLSQFMEKLKGFFSGASEVAVMVGNVNVVAEALKNFFATISNIVTSNLSTILNGINVITARITITATEFYTLGNAIANSTKVGANGMQEAEKTIEQCLSNIVNKVSELPNLMGDALRKGGSALSSALVDIWKEAAKASSEPVNKILDGANWILQQFGSDSRVASWTPYAKGTDGHKGGNALVNDGRGAELVQMPNGNAFIPSGKNVFIPNAPKGMKVLPAEQTAQLMGKSSPTYHYDKGIGDIDIFSYMDNAKGLIDAVKNKFVSYEGLPSMAMKIGKALVSKITVAMVPWAKKMYDEFMVNYDPSSGVGQWRPIVMKALQMEGLLTPQNVNLMLYQMQTESGGNPRSINNWDINAINGTPSKGLMQVIDPTFQAYARPGFNKNVWDPLSNCLAAIRYTVARYGSLANGWHGHGYANGGIANKPSIFGEDGAEMAIPLSSDKRTRAVGLWHKTGDILGMKTRTPETDGGYYVETNHTEENNYAPVFNLTINGTNDDRATARKVKRWVKEAMNDTFESMSRRNPKLQTT